MYVPLHLPVATSTFRRDDKEEKQTTASSNKRIPDLVVAPIRSLSELVNLSLPSNEKNFYMCALKISFTLVEHMDVAKIM
jgi:hypothetical protein